MELSDELVSMLKAGRNHYRKVRGRLERGATISDAMSAVPVADLRYSLTEMMADFEAARHRVRQLTIARGLAEGMTINELGRLWGFSRQLAARYAKERPLTRRRRR